MPQRVERTRLGILIAPAAVWLLLAGAGYVPTLAWGGVSAVEAMFKAQGLVVAVVYGTLVAAMQKMESQGAAKGMVIAMNAAMRRFVLTLVLAGGFVWWGVAPLKVFLIWVAITYVVMIKVETIGLVCWLKAVEKSR